MYGLAVLVVRGERARYRRVVGELARIGAACAHRTATAATPSPARTPPAPPGLAPASSAASGRWGVVPGLETGGGRRGGVRSPAPACVRRGAVRRSSVPSRLMDGAVPRRGGVVLLPCGHGEFFPPIARWCLSSYWARFFEAAAAGVCGALILCVSQSAVSLGWFWAMPTSYLLTRSTANSRSPSSWEDKDARRSY